MQEKNNNKIELNLRNLSILFIFTFVLGGFAMYAGLLSYNYFFPDQYGFVDKNNKAQFDEKQSGLIDIISEEDRVIEVVKKASPAVVSIVATAEVPTFETYYENPFGGFGDIFGFGIPQRRQNGTERLQVGAGTGFLVSQDGYILTNKHVVEDEEAEYTVFLNNAEDMGEKIIAQVLARDPDNDLAILKIDKENLPFLKFGDSDKLQVGQTALTIGYALGEFDNTVSKGVISGLSRSILAGGTYGYGAERLNDLIQSDAAINPGNSGGPMLDLDGKVVGINVAMASAENIGFAIPALEAKNAYEEVRETGTIEEDEVPFLGVRYMIIDENLAEKNKLPYDYGALVVRGDSPEDLAVVPGSPADKAGIVENDIILEIEGNKIDRENILSELILEFEPEEKVELKIFHKGEEKNVEAELEKR